jgi:hypothetical protein
LRQTEYNYLWVIAAACPASGAATGIIMPHLDTDVINPFLGELSRQLAPDVHAVLIWDRAGYHTSGSVEVPRNVSLIPLPPYSPELNPIENLWHYLRSHHGSNRVYEDWEALKTEAVVSMRAVGTDPDKIKSVCAAHYLNPIEVKAS